MNKSSLDQENEDQDLQGLIFKSREHFMKLISSNTFLNVKSLKNLKIFAICILLILSIMSIINHIVISNELSESNIRY